MASWVYARLQGSPASVTKTGFLAGKVKSVVFWKPRSAMNTSLEKGFQYLSGWLQAPVQIPISIPLKTHTLNPTPKILNPEEPTFLGNGSQSAAHQLGRASDLSQSFLELSLLLELFLTSKHPQTVGSLICRNEQVGQRGFQLLLFGNLASEGWYSALQRASEQTSAKVKTVAILQPRS